MEAIVVTGANDQLDWKIVELLLERIPADQIGVSVRDPQKARDLEERGVRVRRGDFADAAMSSNSSTDGPRRSPVAAP